MRALAVVAFALIASACFESLVSLPPPDAGPPVCAAGQTSCDAGCASLVDDVTNCGACDHPCASNEACAEGACYQPTCLATPCAVDQVCIAEHCRRTSCVSKICPGAQTCFQGSCWDPKCATSCAPGLLCLVDTCIDPECVGITCPGTLTCHDGQCLDLCVVGNTCIPQESPCHLGIAACSDAGRVCVDQPQNLPTGTSCADAGVCSAGVCAPCAAGSTCTSAADPCHLGTIGCGTGAPVCQGQAGVVPTGTSCGTDLVCAQGGCVSCAEDAGCQPANACHLGRLSCGGASGPTCADVGGLQSPGSACDVDHVCAVDGGCIACRPGVSCTPTDPCKASGLIDCSQGTPVCTDNANRPAGTACDGGVCSALGVCG
jgi:hypothetical protein